MLPSIFFFLFLTFFNHLVLFVSAKGNSQVSQKLVYPSVRRVMKTWSFKSAKAKGNVTYSDPYVWLEGSTKNKDIQQFITDQTKLTETYMQGCKGKEVTNKALEEALNYDKFPYVKYISGEKPFYLFSLIRAGTESTVWYTASITDFQNAKKSNFQSIPGKPFLNETLLSADGNASILYVKTSPDGKIFGYLVITASQVGKWYFRDYNSPLIKVTSYPEGGEGKLKDVLGLSADQINWMPDNKGIFWLKTVETAEGTNPILGYKVCYHVWGTDQSKDIIIFDSKRAGEMGEYSYFYPYLSPDGHWLVISLFVNSDYEMMTYATKLTEQTISENMKWITLAPSYDFNMFAGGIIEDTYYFLTNKDTKNRKIAKIKLDWSKARTVYNFTELQDRPKVIDVITERKDALINFNGFRILDNDKGVVTYIENGQNTVYLYNIKTGELIQRLLSNEQLTYLDDRGDQNSNTLLMSFWSWNTPSKIFEFKYINGALQTSTVFTGTIKGSNPNDFTIQEFYATSKDGTKIPYFLTNRKDIKKTGKNPTLVNIYGSYGDTYNLYYRPDYFDFIQNYDAFVVWGGVRGGGDRGGDWHEAAKGLKKQKTFDDTIAILEDLIKRKITSPGNLIIEGNGVGGMAVGAVMNQVPEGLLGAAFMVRAICDVFQLELRTTIGAGNVEEFGDVTTPEGFDAVRAWSPLQNIQSKKQYPALLLTPGSFDDQVPPSSSFKFISEMQYDHPNNKLPLLMYVNPTGSDSSITITELTYQFCVLEEALGIKRRNN